jgi:uncharacterized RDD family membrane protein YckC
MVVDAFVGGSMLVMAIIFLLALAATAFWIWMIVDVLVSKRETNEKLLWFLVIFLLHFLGALVYFFAARQRSGSVAGAAT